MPYACMMMSCWKYTLLSLCLVSTTVLATEDISERVLPNGLKVVVKPDERSAIVIFQIWYKVGSANEQPGYTGISHLLEHLMYRGEQKASLAAVYRQMETIGSKGNAYTSRDYTFYYHVLGKEYLALAFALEAERMRHLSVGINEFNIEKSIIREEARDRSARDPYLPATNALYKLAFPDDGYQIPVIGWMADQNSLTLSRVLDWHKNYYTPDNATLVVTGDIEPAKVFTLARQYFSAIKKKGRVPGHHFVENKTKNPATRFVMPDTTKVGMVLVAFKVPSIKTSRPAWEAYALEVLAGWFDSGIHSRLTKALIRNRQMAHEVSVDYAPMNRRQSLFIIEATPAQGVSVQQLERAIIAEIELIKKKLLSLETLKKVKSQMISTEIFERDSMYIQAKIIGQAESVDIPWSEDAKYISRIKAITIEQIKAVLHRYIVPGKKFVVIQNAQNNVKK